MDIEVINRDIVPPAGARQWLVKAKNGQHYIVSGVHAMFTGWEVLVFPADANGTITDFGEVAGGRGIPHEEAIYDLEQYLSRKS